MLYCGSFFSSPSYMYLPFLFCFADTSILTEIIHQRTVSTAPSTPSPPPPTHTHREKRKITELHLLFAQRHNGRNYVKIFDDRFLILIHSEIALPVNVADRWISVVRYCCCVPILLTTFPIPPTPRASVERIHSRGMGCRASV